MPNRKSEFWALDFSGIPNLSLSIESSRVQCYSLYPTHQRFLFWTLKRERHNSFWHKIKIFYVLLFNKLYQSLCVRSLLPQLLLVFFIWKRSICVDRSKWNKYTCILRSSIPKRFTLGRITTPSNEDSVRFHRNSTDMIASVRLKIEFSSPRYLICASSSKEKISISSLIMWIQNLLPSSIDEIKPLLLYSSSDSYCSSALMLPNASKLIDLVLKHAKI